MYISAITTFTDWTGYAGCWGRSGVCRIFEELKIAGIKDVYWRVFNGGLAMYPSRVAEIQSRQCYEVWQRENPYPFATRPAQYLREIDFTHYDPIVDALEIAAEFGINLHLWYSIYEDEHSRPFQCRFNAEHPEYWHTDREGRTYSGTFDWFFDEVREYKLAIVDELLRYPAAGVLLDFVRHNATASADPNGVHRFGYNSEIREAYKKAHGTDPLELPPDEEEWLAFKREIRTSLVREIRRRMDQTETCRTLSLMSWPVDCARWCCLDVPALTRDGAVQMLTAMSLAYSFRPREAELQYRALKDQCHGEGVAILPGLMAYNGLYDFQVDDYAEAAERAGASGIMLYESDKLLERGLTPTVRAINLGLPNYKRSLKATRVDDVECDAGWAELPEFTDFLFHFGPKPAQVPSEKTEVQIAYDDTQLVVRFICWDQNVASVLAPPDEQPQFQYYLDALGQRGPYYDQNSFSVLLDPGHSHADFYQRGVTPRKELTDAAFVDDEWHADWTASVEVGKEAWRGEIRVPFASLGRNTPQPGDLWGLNLMRGIRAANEICIWSAVAGQKPCPHELGHLEFL